MPDSSGERTSLEAREAMIDEAEVDLSFQEAQLRGRERLIGAQREGLTQRAAWLDERERYLVRSEGSAARPPQLAGLADGRALQDSDVEGYVARSATLYLGRVAMMAAREEMLSRRRQLLKARRDELEAYEEAFAKAEVRLAARERLVAKATVDLQRTMSGDTAPPALPTVRAATESDRPPALPPAGVATPARDLSSTGALPKGNTKRVTSTPSFRPAANAPADTGAVPPALPSRTAAPADPEVSVSAIETPTRTRVLVDSDTGTADRHADTVAMDGEEHRNADAALASAKRPSSAHVAAVAMPLDLPDTPPELPDGPPALPRPYRGATISVIGALSIDGKPVSRRQIEFDRSGRTVLISFEGADPQLPKRTDLVWRDHDGSQRAFSVQVRRVVLTPPRGHAVVLALPDWTIQDFDAFAAILERVP